MHFPSGDLKQFIRENKNQQRVPTRETIYNIALECIAGLKELHRQNVLHLDVKPANILLGADRMWKYSKGEEHSFLFRH